MQCSRCAADNREGRRFCAKCGAPLARACPSCGFSNEPGEDFCGGCGTALTSLPGPEHALPIAAPAEPAPRAYTPEHLAERILTSRAALEGERKQVTVLFADLKGSMELLADRDPEDARRILDPVLERMMEAVHRYEGTVNQVMGDGIMALFGAPLAHEDHAVRACYAALQIQEAIQGYADQVFRVYGVPLQIRVGLNSGEVVVRSISTDLHMDYSAIGQTTHLAARMEQAARPGAILLTPDTLRLVEGYVQIKALGPVPIKGLDDPVEVYELIGSGTARSRLQAATARGLTKFVGRDAELDTLRRTLAQAGSGHGQIVALVGEPGVGKSRLVWELTHSHRTQGWLVLASGSVSYGKATSYLPVIDLLRSYCGIEARDDHRRMRQKVLGKVLDLERVLEPALPAFLALLDVPVEDPGWDALDPPQRRQRTLDACKRLLLRESQEQPLLLVCEDLHWVDTETQALLDSLVESVPTARLLLLVNYRPEYAHNWGSKTYYSQLRLDPLPTTSAAELLDALLGSDASVETLKTLLIERTEGNPFFLEESVRTLVEVGVLSGERGAYHLARPLASTQVPATVQAVLAARIDRLPPEDKRLLQAAAVIGKDVPYPLLLAVAEQPEDAVRRSLARLQTAEFLYETHLFPDLEYTFKHALTHEVAYGSLLQERRCTLHAHIADAIEARYPDRLSEQAERLAHHAVHGARWEQALTYLRQSADKAFERTAYAEAVARLEQAVEILPHLPDTRTTMEQAIDLRFGLRTALLPLGEFGRMVEHLREAHRLAETLGDRRRLGWVSVYMKISFQVLGDNASSFAAGRRALDIAATVDDAPLQIVAAAYLGWDYLIRGDYRRAASLYRESLERIGSEQTYDRFGQATIASVFAHAWLSWCLSELGEFGEATIHAEEGVRIAEAANQPWSLIVAYLGSSHVLIVTGGFERCLRRLEPAFDAVRTANTPWWPLVAASTGYAYTHAGRCAEGLPLLEQAVRRSTVVDVAGAAKFFSPLIITWAAEGYLLANRLADAHRSTEQALRLARERGERGHEAYALRLLADVTTQSDPPNIRQAERYYRQALALAEELGMRPLVAHCHLGLGTLYWKIGRDRPAQTELAAAIKLYRGMEMTFWLERAKVQVAKLTD
jgi:class 3 adenylate cyclase/tetratricopeptide (TPR) repeat protein